jgi:hypothetical protein
VKHKYSLGSERAACSVDASISRNFVAKTEKANALPFAFISEAASVPGN